jgi:NAD(P)-dependent dehydrogenase (short-subunit alcohol dehydrogenase family)
MEIGAMAFTEINVKNLVGKRAIVTGAASGLGFEIARVLAGAGVRVVLAGRDQAKGSLALTRIHERVPNATVDFEMLDLASLDSIGRFGERFCRAEQPLDILVNNAGLMAPPVRKLTVDGFELQFGTNHLGHFALTGQLLSALLRSAAPRVVTMSSGIAAFGRIRFEDLQSVHSYAPNAAYTQSKLANLLFARGLQQRSDERAWNILSLAAHPGHARTDLIVNGAGRPTGLKAILVRVLQALASHDAASGALPALMAATISDAHKLDYFAPSHLLHQKGPPVRIALPANAQDDFVSDRLWGVSEQLTGVLYPNH